MSLHQKIIKRGEERKIVSSSHLQNTSTTDNYLKDGCDEYDGYQDQDQDQEYDEANDSYQYDENKLGEILNDSEDLTQNYKAQQYHKQEKYQQQNNNALEDNKHYQQPNPVQKQKQYHNHVIKSKPQNQVNKQKEYDLTDSEDENENQDNGVHYSELEREIYGVSKEQEAREKQERLKKRREQEEAKRKHSEMLDHSKNQSKKKDSRNYNSSPECIQSCSSYFPQTKKVQNECRLPLAISVAPFYEPECLDIINFKTKKNAMYTTPYLNEEDIPRCTSCQTVINPFCEILESLCKWKCNMCFNMQSVPKVYRDSIFNIRAVRTELQYGSYDVLMPNKYRVKRNGEIVYWFMIDVSRESVQNGFLRNTCEGIRNALQSNDLQTHKNNIQIGFIGYDDELHLFNINERLKSPQLYVFKDIEDCINNINEDTVYHLNSQNTDESIEDEKGFFSKIAEKIQFKKQLAKQAVEPKFQPLEYEYPFPDDILNNFGECEKNVFALLDQVEIMYEEKYKKYDLVSLLGKEQGATEYQKQQQNIFYKALEFSLDHIKFTGGRLFIFHSSSEIQQPPNKKYTLFSILNKMEDTFIVPTIFYQQGSLTRDLTSFIYKIVKESNGEIEDISPAAISSHKYKNDLTESISQKYSYESVLRFRCSNGWSITSVQGNTQIRSNTYNLLNLNCDTKTHITIEIQNEISQNQINFFCFQSCLLYTNLNNQRVMRVHNFIMPLTNQHINIFTNINSKVLMSYYAKLYLQAIINRVGDNKQFESYIIQELKLLVSNQIQYNRAALVPSIEIMILSILGLFKQKCLLQKDFPHGMDSALNQIISYQRMGPSELDSQFVPLLFDFQDIQNSSVYDENGVYIFPKSLSLNYQSIYDKEIIIADFGKEFIVFVLTENVRPETLLTIFNKDDIQQIKNITKEEFYKNTSKDSEKIMLLLNSLQMLKSRNHLPFSIIVTNEGDPREFEFYYKLIEDKYDSYLRGYSKSYEELIDLLLKQNN